MISASTKDDKEDVARMFDKYDFMAIPVVDSDGMLKPALFILLEHLDEAGIDEIALIIGSPGASSSALPKMTRVFSAC